MTDFFAMTILFVLFVKSIRTVLHLVGLND